MAAGDLSKVSVRQVSAVNDAGSKTTFSIRDLPPIYTDEPIDRGGTNQGPTPQETVLVALLGCEAVITHRQAASLKVAYESLDMQATGTIDPDGRTAQGRPRPYFSSVDLDIRFTTDEDQERIDRVGRAVEERCPVLNLLRDAKVDVKVRWLKDND